MTRKPITIRSSYHKAVVALDAAQRAVFALEGRTDIRLCDILAKGGPVVDRYNEALAIVEALQTEARQHPTGTVSLF